MLLRRSARSAGRERFPSRPAGQTNRRRAEKFRRLAILLLTSSRAPKTAKTTAPANLPVRWLFSASGPGAQGRAASDVAVGTEGRDRRCCDADKVERRFRGPGVCRQQTATNPSLGSVDRRLFSGVCQRRHCAVSRATRESVGGCVGPVLRGWHDPRRGAAGRFRCDRLRN